ncbi:MAG: hypothetical protein OXH63_16200 [Gemmatimonadetes bacterium]|nr:hypothetical protein [Gemmatimonadota bacterium]
MQNKVIPQIIFQKVKDKDELETRDFTPFTRGDDGIVGVPANETLLSQTARPHSGDAKLASAIRPWVLTK